MNSKTIPSDIRSRIESLVRQSGFQHFGITGIALDDDARHLHNWLALDRHGEMQWMQNHAELRANPDALLPGTISVISVGLDYGRRDEEQAWTNIHDGDRAYVARYALGRDYHKMMRQRLQKLADEIASMVGAFGHRVFVDSAPVLERAIARNAGLGWIGKHTCLIDKQGGSWFFLGELFLDFELPADEPATEHCGTCTRCIDVCPTQAIVAPYQLDARKCIAYLTIEHPGSIPIEYREAIGNRIFGCDDCQLVCPWNKFAKRTDEPDFRARNDLDTATLADLIAWTEDEFLKRTEGTAIRRSGYQRWQRNILIALGNAPYSEQTLSILREYAAHDDEVVSESAQWALKQQLSRGLDPAMLK